MPERSPRTQFLISLFATPSPAHRDIFYTVTRAGHLIAGSDHHIQRDHFPGHELILCLRGRGWFRVGGRRGGVKPGELLWLNCHTPHEYGADLEDPWELLWIRIEGPKLEAMCTILAVDQKPVFDGFDAAGASLLFQELFQRIASDAPESPAFIHAAVARLLALAFCARKPRSDAEPVVPAALRRPVERMKLFYFERHTLDDLAQLAGMSPTHFARVFRQTFGTSPIDWLRRERISQAKRRLAETTASIKEIAEQTGYHDRYFFSKDFKQNTGLTPSQFRQRETAG
jgi:AraC-like DNA-binding protein